MNCLDDFMEKPCYIIDFLPEQVPKDCGGQFFKVEDYLLNNYKRCGLRDKFFRIILKLMCYYRVSIYWDKWIEQPAPEQVAEIIDKTLQNRYASLDILLPEQDVLLHFDADSLNLSIYNPAEEMREIMKQIAWSEGMFFRQAAELV